MVVDPLVEAAEALERGNIEEALGTYRAIIAEDPTNADAQRLLGVALMQWGDQAAALEHLNAALLARPGFAEAMVNIGDVCARRRLIEEALIWYDYAIGSNPNYAIAHFNRALMLEKLNRPIEAIKSLQEALRIEPTHVGTLIKIAAFAEHYRDFPALREASARLTRIAPTPQAYWMLGYANYNLGNFDWAMEAYHNGLALGPDVRLRVALGETLERVGRHKEALVELDLALAIDARHGAAYSAKGNVLKGLGRLPEAIASYETALKIEPENGDYHLNMGIALLQQGHYERAWRHYGYLWSNAPADRLPYSGQKTLWDRSPFKGKRLLINADQGFGDYLMCLRFLPQVRARGGTIIAEVHDALRPLLEGKIDVDEIVRPSPARDADSFDLYLPAMGMASLFTRTPADVPAPAPVLKADPAVVEKWQSELKLGRETFNVAINWVGRPGQVKDHERSTSLQYFKALATPGVRWISIQKPDCDHTPPEGMTIERYGERIQSFADTAAIMSLVDMVITVDSAPAHLAGLMGRPTCVLLAFDPHWIYGNTGWSTPWYPAMRLFRQKSPGDWPSAFATLAQFMRKVLTSKKSA